jgi:Holliday junction resolvase-like predicted endonuclease
MVQDHSRLEQLIAEYGRLRELSADEASSRGQRFNHFLAELLQSWGIKASSSITSSGEIDVGFELEGQRFIVEAKWEQKRTDTGQIAKLQKRLRQRLGGTIGLFISMFGYTQDALNDLKEGEQLAVLCLSRDYVEAMLSEFIPPDELLSELVTKASLRGEAYVPLSSLFDVPPVSQLISLLRLPYSQMSL